MTDFHKVDELLAGAISARNFPGAVYLIATDQKILQLKAFGAAVIIPTVIPARPDTIYDLASLTKPLVTTLLFVLLMQENELGLPDAISHYLPELATDDKREITLLQLLTHSSGLPAWRPLYAESGTPANIARQIAQVALENRPGSKVIYSDLGFILLGKLLERISGQDLATLARERIFSPLQLTDACFNPPPDLRLRIAATEEGNCYEAEMTAKAGYQYQNWRHQMLWGEVHDGNAHFLGGVAGHAGLFATASDTFRLARQFLTGSQLVAERNLSLFSTNFTPGCGIDRSIGWTLATNRQGAAGDRLPSNAFGHSGFTGTSVWLDPDKKHTFILLTNRVHPQRSDCDMDEIRREFHNVAVDALSSIAL